MSSTHTDPTAESPTSPAPSRGVAGATPEPVAPHADGAARPTRSGCASVALGVLLVLVGVPMLVCPGPSVAAVAAGVGMIAVGLGLRRSGEDT